MAERITAPAIKAMKGAGKKIVSLTAYDTAGAQLADGAGVDIILVGDSLGNVLLGFSSTLFVTLDMMVHHTAAVARGVKRGLLVADLPFGSYQSSTAQAVDSSVALMRAGAQAVKLEGPYCEAIEAIVKAGIPVMGHLGMTPQSVHAFGGHRVQGKGDQANAIKQQAKDVESAGAFSMVLELVPAETAKMATESVGVPTIGIGAGPFCDGQVQVFHDILGLSGAHYKHAKAYVNGRELFEEAVARYCEEVRSQTFPTSENSF